MIISIFAGIALFQRQRAESQRRLAVANQLVARAELVRNQAPNQLPQSVLLATEAVQRFRDDKIFSAEAASTLHQGLAWLPKPIAPITVSSAIDGAWSKVVVSADGRYLAAAKGKHACVWDAEDYKPKDTTAPRCVAYEQEGASACV